LNDGQIPNPNVVRVAPGTDYHRVEGSRRASRNGHVSDPPPEIAIVTIRNCVIIVVYLLARGGASGATDVGDLPQRVGVEAAARDGLRGALVRRLACAGVGSLKSSSAIAHSSQGPREHSTAPVVIALSLHLLGLVVNCS
jgi:hypothetical protein